MVEAKALVPYGEWLNWLKENFSATNRTAHRYMNLADSTRVSNLEASSIREALRMIAGEDEEDELAGMIAARLADLKNGERGNGRVAAPIGAATTEGKTRDEAAAEIRVSEFVTHDEFARPPRPRPRGSPKC